ncbi:hypothetical protein NADFUDRAFT_81973 [Nadsonia fulvescens var. elongata DSM 6958]|uniref:Phosphoinositide phospholipase C n=1 Tax=Nadsonia fulvescens var. elongata DSM 6958 TaxID=857566 RepID=A0A1E3PQC5_9ASCO|nr:hypothetical protein NADFUDRAFT_81973 [Nadsonia fulvescens var. elongata DSM 6958]
MILQPQMKIPESNDSVICMRRPTWPSLRTEVCACQESPSHIEGKSISNPIDVAFEFDPFISSNFEDSMAESVTDKNRNVDPLSFESDDRISHSLDFVDALTLELENLSDSRKLHKDFSTNSSSPGLANSRASASLLNISPLMGHESFEATCPIPSPISTGCSHTNFSTSLIRRLSRGAAEKIGIVHNSLAHHDSDGIRGARSILGRKRGKENTSSNISRRQSTDSVSSPGPLTRHKGGIMSGSPVSSSPQSSSPFFITPDCSPFLSSSSLLHTNIPHLNLNQERSHNDSLSLLADNSQLTEEGCFQNVSHIGTAFPFSSNFVLPDGQVELKEPPKVPSSLQAGVIFLRLTHKKKVQRTFRINPEDGVLSWDSKASSKLFIDKIYEIRVGAEARNYREEFNVSSELEHRWATIIYSSTNHKLKALHIVAPTRKEFDTFIDVLESLFRYRQEIMSGLAMPGERFVNTHWKSYVIKDDGEERLSFESVEKLTRRLHVNCSKKYLKDVFSEADVDNSGFLNFTEFQEFVKLLKTRREVVDIFFKVLGIDASSRRKSTNTVSQSKEPHKLILPTDLLSFTKFRHFIKYTQKENFDDYTLERIFRKFAKTSSENYIQMDKSIDNGVVCDSDNDNKPSSSALSFMSFEAFSEFLNSSYTPLCVVHKEDLSHPLNEYFISSSHNTYLMGRQVGGTSTIEGYIRSLQRGCRCVEIDCWDGINGPVVNHGRTFTSSIDFADVISTIRKYAFISTPFPLILSLEVHCNFENQIKMVETLRSILAERLVVTPISNNLTSLPSPLELKHRILIKVKSGGDMKIPGATVFDSSTTFIPNTSESPKFMSATDSGTSGLSEEFSAFSDETNDYVGKRRNKKKTSNRAIGRPLGDLGVYVCGLKFRNFSLPESKTYNHIFSMSERIFNNMSKDSEKKRRIEKHNRKFLMRVYPAGYRVTSNNFSPCIYWQRGVQMVALNWQTYDLGVQINHAMFETGDRSGYVLKPINMRSPTVKKMINEEDLVCPKIMSKGIKVSIDIISAQQLPRPKDLKIEEPFNPYIIMEMFGPTSDTLLNSTANPPYSSSTNNSSNTLPGVSSSFPLSRIRSKSNDKVSPSRAPTALGRWKTPVVHENGFNPIWNCKYNISVERSNFDFVFVRFSVCSGDNVFAVNTIRLKSLNQGYRHVPLNDLQGEEYIFSTLFIKSGIID